MAHSGRPLTFLVFLLHPGYVRYFAPVLRLLSQRGHHVHLAFSQGEKDPGDAALLDQLVAECPGLTAGLAPVREPDDGWRSVALLLRSLADLARFSHPRYRDAPALRARIRRRFCTVVDEGPRLPGPARTLLRALIHVTSAPRSARATDTIVRQLVALERALPTAASINRFVARRRPDAVVASPVIDFASTQVDYLESAAALGIPSAVAVASWDNLTGKGLLRANPDRVFVWNATQRAEAVSMHGIPYDRIVLTGAPKFDEWFERMPSCTAEEFAAQVGLPATGHVLYVCSSPFIAPDEVSFVREWLLRLRSADRVSDLPVLVRPHPQNATQWAGVDFLEDERTVVWPVGGEQPDAGDARSTFFDSLAYSSAVVGVNTSALIEAAIVGKPVLSVLSERFRGTQEGTLHFHYLLHDNGGFLHVARDLDDHIRQLTEAVAGGRERSDRFVDAFVRPLGRDVIASAALADALEALAEIRSDPVRRTIDYWMRRAVLTPLAVTAAAMARARTS